MTKMNRFIQFNDESVDTKSLLLYERLSRALADTNTLELTERKLLEFNPSEGILSMSVFWRHRHEDVMHKGRLSDIYLLSVGFWKHFSVSVWLQFSNKYKLHPLRKLAEELLLLLEEFRLTDVIIKQRPGTVHAFNCRQKYYTIFHQESLHANSQKGYVADALLNDIYLSVYTGMFTQSARTWQSPSTDSIQIDFIKKILSNIYDARNTKDNTFIVQQIIEVIEDVMTNDLFHQYYSIAHSIADETVPFNYHEGLVDAEKGEDTRKDTIEEVFRSWHEENEEEQGIHLQYELEHGRSSESSSGEAQPGSEEASIDEIGIGQSKGDDRSGSADAHEELDKKSRQENKKEAGTKFGKEHVNVVYEELEIETINEQENLSKLIRWREEQKPYVRSFVTEMRKRIETKKHANRDRLMIGRLSKKLTTIVVDERPKPFYKKSAPSVQLDAVFGLLVDGSASMIDKLDETKKAVLLFHDVLRELKVKHDISLYYEDAYKASSAVQPNVFEQVHTFIDSQKDSGLSILSIDAHEDNRDGFAIRWMADRLAGAQEKHKFLLLFSDGEPSAFGYDRNGIIDTAEAVMEAEKKGIAVIHLFLSAEEPTEDQKQLFAAMFGNKSASSSSVDSFTDQTLRILRKLLTIVIRQL